MKRPDKESPASRRLQAAMLAKDKQKRANHRDLAKATAAEPSRRNDLVPELHLVERAPERLVTPKRNVRKLHPAHVKEVANAIKELGFCAPVLINEDDAIIDGVARVEAAKWLGLPTVPCVVAEHLTPKQQRLLRLASNRLGEKGTWDISELRIEMEELIVLDVPIEISGFDLSEVDNILSDDEEENLEKGPLEPEPNARAVSRLGDRFRLGRHTLVCADARVPAVLAGLMGDKLARAVFTDQPYNVAIAGHVTGGAHREFKMASGEMTSAEFDEFNVAWIEASLPYIMEGGLLATFIDWRGLPSVTAAAFAAGLAQINLVVWGKTNAGMGSLYRSQHELLPMFKKGSTAHVNNVDLGRKGRHRSNLWTYPGASSLGSDARQGLQQHPTVKPTAMLVDALMDFTNPGDIVIDPFLGSGSTLIAAEAAGRVCRGIEIDPMYVDVIARRFEEETGEAAVLESTGEPFKVLEQRRLAENGSKEASTAAGTTAPPAEDIPKPRARVRTRPNRG